MILDKVNFPKDLRNLSVDEMNTLAQEMRELIIKKVNTTGGHMGPNLGMVEATIAMHYVFNAPVDKIVFDVSHQCYPHKILTGRKEGFLNPEKYLTYTGYTAPEESEYDVFKVGHTSTSVSLATGLAKARDLRGTSENVIAIIGDGSLSGGEAFEGLNNAAVLNSNFIVFVNDNDMSIAENHGGLYDNLKLLRETNGKAECNFFKTLGYEYYYLEEGNDIQKLIELFEQVKDINRPVVLHVKTLKGKGLKQAVENKEGFHWILPHTLDEDRAPSNFRFEDTNNGFSRSYLLNKAKEEKDFVVIAAGTPGAFGFDKAFRDELGKQYTDVAIAEPHAIAYASSLAKGGAKPVLYLVSSFVQRTYDQLSQDLALNNSPATIVVTWGGLSAMDSTHLGCFDIPLVSNIPNITYLAPTTREEYKAMLDYSISQTESPVAIRLPFNDLKITGVEDNTDYSIKNKYKIVHKGEKVAIIGLGNFFELGEKVYLELKNKYNIDSTLINPKFITGLDENLLEELKQNHRVVITLEDGVLDGGFGEKISRFYGSSDMKVLNYGAKKEFTDRVSLDEILVKNRIIPELISEDVLKVLNAVCV